MDTIRLYDSGSPEERAIAYDEYIVEHKSAKDYANSPMCQKCILNYKESYVRGEMIIELGEEEYEKRKSTNTLPKEVFFPVSCNGDLRHGPGDLSVAVTDEDFAAAGLFNPDVWFEEELGIELRYYQSDSASCTARAKVDRWGRRCLPASEKVLLADGSEKSIKSIKVGTEVICTEDQFISKKIAKVIDRSKNGVMQIFKITLEDKRFIRCTSNHPLYVVTDEDWRWESIDDGLAVKDQVLVLVDSKKGGYSCSSIVSIEEDGVEETYDIEVEEYHNFIVNGIVTHNTGKTHHKVGGLLHRMQLGKGIDENGAIIPEKILVLTPFQAQIDEIFDKVDTMVAGSRTLRNCKVARRKSPSQYIEFSNGSRMTGFCIGSNEGSNSDKTRGQDATTIYMDELDTMMDKDVESVMAIMASRADTALWTTSTPSGKRAKLYQFSTQKDLGFKETHVTAMQSPEWNETTERILRRQYSQATWDHEILAIYGEVEGGVFPTNALLAGLRSYKYGEELLKPNCIVTMGIDWNGVDHGIPIIVVAYYPTENSYQVIDKYTSADKEYTQLSGVRDIIMMYNKWKPNAVYLDAGFSTAQFEMLRKYAGTSGDRKMADKFKNIHMQGNIEIRDPLTKQKIKKQNKALMIDLAVQRVENHMCFFPRDEDAKGKLVDQLRNFTIERYTPNGNPVYSQGEDHELVAWCLAMYAISIEFSDICKVDGRSSVSYLPPLIGSNSLQANDSSDLSFNELMRADYIARTRDRSKDEPPTGSDIKLGGNVRTISNTFARTNNRAVNSRATGRRTF